MTTQFILQYRNDKGDWIELHVYRTKSQARGVLDHYRQGHYREGQSGTYYRIVKREFTPIDTVVYQYPSKVVDPTAS